MICTIISNRTRLAYQPSKLWQPGQTLNVSFMGGLEDRSLELCERIAKSADEWTQYANIHFNWTLEELSIEASQIRVAFIKDQGSWSYVGTDALTVSKLSPTMNLGWLTDDTPDAEVDRVVKHEFGHALGCIHEHQNPAGGIKWNKAAVYAWYMKRLLWSKDVVDSNIFAVYEDDMTNHTEVDPKSIMMYSIPKEFTMDGFHTETNVALSDMDKQFISAAYPWPDEDHTTPLSQSES